MRLGGLQFERDDGTESHAEITADAIGIVTFQRQRLHVEGFGRADRNTASALHAGAVVDLDMMFSAMSFANAFLLHTPHLTTTFELL